MNSPLNRLTKLHEKASKVDDNYCAVIATAFVTGISYAKAKRIYKKFGRKDNLGTAHLITHQVIRKLGFRLRVIPRFTNSTARQVIKHIEKHSEGSYLISLPGHLIGAVGGTVVDTMLLDNQQEILTLYKVRKRK